MPKSNEAISLKETLETGKLRTRVNLSQLVSLVNGAIK